ncbi:MAG: methylated-DNA/protein-cysteinemethyltransferase [Clostridia bacterium]|jgi:O-6-methylguanine DNA methyltransferase|nr:methylated-DNA/protein-cysteinemethyltransferase [Clostridia bacterium]
MSTVYFSEYVSPIGSLYVAASEEGICNIAFPGQYESDFMVWLQKNFNSIVQQKTDILRCAIAQLAEYFNRQRTVFTVPLHLIGTQFQRKVWNELIKVPYGTTVTYGYIASKIGNSKAGRAVGGANNKNPVPIIVPCHRIIGQGGKLVGYGGGLELKQKLLAIEGVKC